MPKIIKDAQVVDDEWTILEADEFNERSITAYSILPVAIWNKQRDELQSRDDIGVWLETSDAIDDIEGDIRALPVIAIRFRSFADGRGFSIARLLRERYGYTGELRAIDGPIRDQLDYLRRCGFNAFSLLAHYDLTDSLSSLNDFSENYQSSAHQEAPLFRRR